MVSPTRTPTGGVLYRELLLIDDDDAVVPGTDVLLYRPLKPLAPPSEEDMVKPLRSEASSDDDQYRAESACLSMPLPLSLSPLLPLPWSLLRCDFVPLVLL